MNLHTPQPELISDKSTAVPNTDYDLGLNSALPPFFYDNKKRCPKTIDLYGNFVICIGEQCQQWMHDAYNCADVVIADALRKIAKHLTK